MHSASRLLQVAVPNHLGDAVMALPSLHRLASVLGDTQLRLVGRPLAALVLDGQGPWPEVSPDWQSDPGGAALLLAPSLRVAVAAVRSRCAVRVGTPTDWRRPLLTHSVSASIRSHHQRDIYTAAVDSILAVLAGRRGSPLSGPADFCVQPDSTPPLFVVDPEGYEWWESAGGPEVVFHPWAAGNAAKRWPLDRWVELGRHCGSVAVTGGPAGQDAAFAERLADRLGAPCAAGPSALSPAAWGALAQAASDVVLPDTGLAHLASAAGVCPVVLFGATAPARYAPDRARVLCADSMAALKPAQVLAELKSLNQSVDADLGSAPAEASAEATLQ